MHDQGSREASINPGPNLNEVLELSPSTGVLERRVAYAGPRIAEVSLHELRTERGALTYRVRFSCSHSPRWSEPETFSAVTEDAARRLADRMWSVMRRWLAGVSCSA